MGGGDYTYTLLNLVANLVHTRTKSSKNNQGDSEIKNVQK